MWRPGRDVIDMAAPVALTSVPLRSRPVSNSPWIRHHCENPRTQGWGWSKALDHRDKEGALEAATLCRPRPSPTRAPRQTQTAFLGLQFLQRESESPRRTCSCPSVERRFPGVPVGCTSQESLGKSVELGHRVSAPKWRSARPTASGVQIWDCVAPPSSDQAEIPASGSGHLQSRGGWPVWPGYLVGSSARLRSPATELCLHGVRPAPCLGKPPNLKLHLPLRKASSPTLPGSLARKPRQLW